MRFEGDWDNSQRWRIQFARLCLLNDASLEPKDLQRLAQELVANLDPSQQEHWSNTLSSVPEEFMHELETQLSGKWQQTQRQTLFSIIASRRENSDDANGLLRLLRAANSDDFIQVIPVLVKLAIRSESEVKKLLFAEFEQTELKSPSQLSSDDVSQWRAKLALVACALDDWERVDRVLSFSTDPRSRNYFIYWFKQCGISVEPLLDRFGEYRDDWRPAAVLACLSSLPPSSLGERVYAKSNELLCNAYEEHPSSAVHRAVRKMLVGRGENSFVNRVDATEDSRIVKEDRNWFLNSEGMQMNIIRGPVQFWFGRPHNDKSQPGRIHVLENTFAVSDEAVSEKHFSRFDSTRFESPNESAATGVSLLNAVSYCDWLNDKENIEHRASIVGIDAEVSRFEQSEKGYRLPTLWEWEYFARRGTMTSFSFGEIESQYCRTVDTSKSDAVFLFGPEIDVSIHPSVPEWTSTLRRDLLRNSKENLIKTSELIFVKGGVFSHSKSTLPLCEYKLIKPDNKTSCGFRIARTIN